MGVTSMARSSWASPIKYNDFLAGNVGFGTGSFDSIATVTTAAGATAVDFSNIPQTYASLHVRIFHKASDTSDGMADLLMGWNGGTGSYAAHGLSTNTSTIDATGVINQTRVRIGRSPNSSTTLANAWGATIVDIHDYSLIRYKSIRSQTGSTINNSNSALHFVGFLSGMWGLSGGAAITTLEFRTQGTAFAAGSVFALYGIGGK